MSEYEEKMEVLLTKSRNWGMRHARMVKYVIRLRFWSIAIILWAVTIIGSYSFINESKFWASAAILWALFMSCFLHSFYTRCIGQFRDYKKQCGSISMEIQKDLDEFRGYKKENEL